MVRKEEVVKMVLREVDEKADPLAVGFCSSESAVLASVNLVICVLGNLTLFAEKKQPWYLCWKLLWKASAPASRGMLY